MRATRALVMLALGCGLALGQESGEEELTAYSLVEIENYLHAFKTTYAKGAPEEDAVAVLADLKKAYRYLASKGDQITKDEKLAMGKIVKVITRGLRARKRPMVTLECARVLGEIGDPAASKVLTRWLEKVLDEKSPNPLWVEWGFVSLAWIGPQDRRAQDLALKYATTGRHPDISVAAYALRACYEWRYLKPKVRKEWFNKILGYLSSLWSGARSGDVKRRGDYDRKYKAVKDAGLRALAELAGGGASFVDPPAAMKWWNEHKRGKWEPYTGPRFRSKRENKPAEAASKEAAPGKGGGEAGKS